MSSDEDQVCEDSNIYGMKDSFSVKLGRRRSKRKQTFIGSNQEIRSRHNRRKVKGNVESICPVCQLTLRQGELESHFNYEWEKLTKSLICRPTKRSSVPRSSQSSELDRGIALSEQGSLTSDGTNTTNSFFSTEDSNQPSSSRMTSFPSEGPSTSHSGGSSMLGKGVRFKEPGHESYKRVKVNRLLRLQSKRWQLKDLGEEATCPVCGESVLAQTPEELQMHVDKCLRKQEGEESSEEELDVEGDEYEWCGMRKVRLTSLLKSQGQLDALGTLVEKGDEDANVEVCLLQEEEESFGPSQYSQNDLSQHFNNSDSSDEVEMEDYHREPTSPHSADESYSQSPGGDESRADIEEGKPQEDISEDRPSRGPKSAVVEALQQKVRELEEKGSFICHICHGPYDVPLTSVVCWHVHCEKCWLQALSAQRLCPQCKVIVSPTELRKIYL